MRRFFEMVGTRGFIPGLGTQFPGRADPEIFIQYSVDITDESTEEEQLALRLSNKFVDIFGPIFEAREIEAETPDVNDLASLSRKYELRIGFMFTNLSLGQNN